MSFLTKIDYLLLLTLSVYHFITICKCTFCLSICRKIWQNIKKNFFVGKKLGVIISKKQSTISKIYSRTITNGQTTQYGFMFSNPGKQVVITKCLKVECWIIIKLLSSSTENVLFRMVDTLLLNQSVRISPYLCVRAYLINPIPVLLIF